MVWGVVRGVPPTAVAALFAHDNEVVAPDADIYRGSPVEEWVRVASDVASMTADGRVTRTRRFVIRGRSRHIDMSTPTWWFQ